MVLSETHT